MTNRCLFTILLASALVPAAAAPAADSAPLRGVVVDDAGEPLAGAIVTLTGREGHSISVYSDGDGAWRLDIVGLRGEPTLRARLPRRADTSRTLAPDAYDGEPLVLRMAPYQSKEALAASLTASAHAATIDWRDRAVEETFVGQCLFCHQIGNDWTRKDEEREYWDAVVGRMEGYGSMLTWKESRVIRGTLTRSFDDPAQAKPPQEGAGNEELAEARYREWAFGAGGNFVHDIEIGRDGKLYGVDMGNDLVWIIDRRSNEVEQVAFPESDLPLGGMFSGGIAPLGTFTARRGPHSIVQGPDGRMYMTCALSAEICIFDPETREFEFVPTGGDSVYPHTLRFDGQGVLWFTVALSNQIGRMDVTSNEIDLIQLPANGFLRAMTDAMLPTILEVSSWFGQRSLYVHLSHHKISGGHEVLNLPYGIDINPVDGSVWYSKLYADFIGRVDPETLEVEEYPTPYDGPRRMRFAADGTLWIPSFNEGVLMAFDTEKREFVADYRLPRLNEGEYETPYALNIHPETGEVWITGNMSDRMLRFRPETGRFLSYPSPTRTMFARDVVFGPDGEVCTSNSNLPASAIEGGRPKMVCIEPKAYPQESS